MTVAEWVAIWQKTYDAPAVRHTTYEAHRYVLENHILPRLGDLPLETLTTTQVAAFLSDCQLHGNKRRQEPLSKTTMRHIQNLLSKVLRQAVADGLLTQNPAESFCFYTDKKIQATILGEREIDEYLSAAQELGYLPIFLLALEYGLRQRELIALKWSDVDPKRSTLTIYEDRVVSYRQLVEYGEKSRTIVLSQFVTEQLVKEHRKHPHSEVLFIHPGTLKPYSPAMIRLLHNRVLAKANMDHIRFEDLRHTCAVRAIQNGSNLHQLAKQLGKSGESYLRCGYQDWLPGSPQIEPDHHQDKNLYKAAEKIGAWFEDLPIG